MELGKRNIFSILSQHYLHRFFAPPTLDFAQQAEQVNSILDEDVDDNDAVQVGVGERRGLGAADPAAAEHARAAAAEGEPEQLAVPLRARRQDDRGGPANTLPPLHPQQIRVHTRYKLSKGKWSPSFPFRKLSHLLHFNVNEGSGSLGTSLLSPPSAPSAAGDISSQEVGGFCNL